MSRRWWVYHLPQLRVYHHYQPTRPISCFINLLSPFYPWTQFLFPFLPDPIMGIHSTVFGCAFLHLCKAYGSSWVCVLNTSSCAKKCQSPSHLIFHLMRCFTNQSRSHDVFLIHRGSHHWEMASQVPPSLDIPSLLRFLTEWFKSSVSLGFLFFFFFFFPLSYLFLRQRFQLKSSAEIVKLFFSCSSICGCFIYFKTSVGCFGLWPFYHMLYHSLTIWCFFSWIIFCY